MDHFISLADFSPAEIDRLLQAAIKLKSLKKSGRAGSFQPLKGAAVALLFEKPSLRTRVSFEVAISDLGGHPIYLGPNEVGLGKRESVSDVSRNLSRWVCAIVARTFKHGTLVELADTATVPVVNALSDREHPCQALGDILTILERKKRLKGVTLCFIGDGNNVCHALLHAAAKTGMHVRVACPPGYEPQGDILAAARDTSKSEGGSIQILRDPAAAARDADAIYTDVWVSMGFEKEEEARRRAFAGYRVDAALMSTAKKDAIFLHCLPARRGEEVTDGVLDGGQSAVLDQAENRMHSAKAVLLALVAPKSFSPRKGKPRRKK